MSRLHCPKYLVKRSEIYYFRIAIPQELRVRFGKSELKASLHTDNRLVARQHCRSLTNKFEQLFLAAGAMSELSQTTLHEIAQRYFRELLIQGNERIFFLEEPPYEPEDRVEAIESA